MEAHLGPFAANAPGLGYLDYLAEFDSDAEMWRQIVPNQRGRGLALGRWGLHHYEEYQDMIEPASYEGDPLWIPMLVEWASVTTLEGPQIKLDPWYLEQFHSADWVDGSDALPVVGILSINAPWPSLAGPWSVNTRDGVWWDITDTIGGDLEMVMPVNQVLPIEDEAVLGAIGEAIYRMEGRWPLDNCGPTGMSARETWDGEDHYQQAVASGHKDLCFDVQNPGTAMEWMFLSCTWDPSVGACRPCGGGAHIEGVLDSFLGELPYERLVFDPLLIPFWDRLKDRNVRFYQSILTTLETERSKGRSWYYSYSQRWSPWGHSSQVPVLLPV